MNAEFVIDAYAAMGKGGALRPYRYQRGVLGAHDVAIAITHCGVCHSDVHLLDNDWNLTSYPFVPGHEIVGIIVASGSEVARLRIGERVGVGWLAGSCMECPQCLGGNENLCRQGRATCVAGYGGYAVEVCVDGRFAVPVPNTLPSEQAAPLLCAGITVFAPLHRAGLKSNGRVGVVGLGGLGHLAVQYGKAMGSAVTVFSTTAAKAEEAYRFGADRFVAVERRDSIIAEAGTCDLILATVPVDLPWAEYLRALKPNGALCIVGAVPGEIKIPALDLIDGQKSVGGSAVGSNHQIREMFQFSVKHGIAPAVELYPMKEVNRAIERLRVNRVRYRAVLVNES
ncbi:MAG: NAD(P)-dependent alcohol dehydrogenase [Chloroflexota bacterium]